MKLFIGYDSREAEAYAAAARSLQLHSPQQDFTALEIERLYSSGLLSRPMDRRGSLYDLASNANCSTDFAISRFLVPILAQTGWALFVDCDVLFFSDAVEILQHADPTKAVMVVKHPDQLLERWKMDQQIQQPYRRKNWSSVMLFNCDHPANRRLSIRDINERPGRDLHAFYWLHDNEIGELPAAWNWLVGIQSRPDDLKIAHFTLGGPWLDGWKGSTWDQLWLDNARI
jgi:hypothetical protein